MPDRGSGGHGKAGRVQPALSRPGPGSRALLAWVGTQQATVHLEAVQGVGIVVELLPRVIKVAGEAWILRTFMGIHEHRHVPSLLVGETPAASEWHVRLDEASGVVQLVHARAPVVGLRAPQRREHLAPRDTLSLAVIAMTERAVVGEHRLAAGKVRRQRWGRDLRIASAG